MRPLPPAAIQILQHQCGLARGSQLIAADVAKDAIVWRVRQGYWQRVLPGIFAAFSGVLTEDQRLIAAALYGGCDAQVTGAAALRFHGVRYVPATRQVEVLVPTAARARRSGFAVTRRTRWRDLHPAVHHGIEVCSPSRSLVALARNVSKRVLRAVAADAFSRGLMNADGLTRELIIAPMRRRAVLRSILSELIDGIRSAPEAELRQLLKQSSILPRIRWNPRLRAADGDALPIPDAWIPDARLAIEVDSREFHFAPHHWERTMDRHNRLVQQGILVLHFTPKRIRSDGAEVLRVIEAAYCRRVSSGVAKVGL